MRTTTKRIVLGASALVFAIAIGTEKAAFDNAREVKATEKSISKVYDQIEQQQANNKPQCAEQTIASNCEPRDDVDYSEPIMSGVSKYNSFTNEVEQCPYLYSHEQRKNYFEVYECDQGDDVYQYRTSDNKEVYDDEVAELTSNASY